MDQESKQIPSVVDPDELNAHTSPQFEDLTFMETSSGMDERLTHSATVTMDAESQSRAEVVYSRRRSVQVGVAKLSQQLQALTRVTEITELMVNNFVLSGVEKSLMTLLRLEKLINDYEQKLGTQHPSVHEIRNRSLDFIENLPSTTVKQLNQRLHMLIGRAIDDTGESRTNRW